MLVFVFQFFPDFWQVYLSQFIVDFWQVAIIMYLILVPLTALIVAKLTRPDFNVNSAGYPSESPYKEALFISEELKKWLEQHYRQLIPVLKKWQRRAWIYGWIHFYVVGWTTVTSLLIPLVIQYTGNNTNARLLVQIASIFSALVYGLHSVFKVQKNFQKYRVHESSVYNVIRDMRDNPEVFGQTDDEKRILYRKRIEDIRTTARNDEIDNIPSPVSPSSKEA